MAARRRARPPAVSPVAPPRAAARAPASQGGGRLRRFAAGSVLAHAAAAALALLWFLPPRPRPPEVPATIQVLFGDNADRQGTPPPPAPALPPPPALPTPPAPASTAQAAPPEDGDAPAGPASATPAPSTPPKAAAPLPVRLGEGDVGLKLTEPPDAGMIEAQADPGNRAPKYPELASRQHQRGRVVIRMHIDTQGRVSEAEILESSGHPALDRAAREALALWHFIPALREGVAVPSYRDQATNFVLEGD